MRKGFTLIELLVVVLIMGILASVAMPQYFKSVEKSRSAEAIGILSSYAASYERVAMKKGTPPNIEQFNLNNDMGTPNMSYFTNPNLTIKGGDQVFFSLYRNTHAGGGLGSYWIQVSFYTHDTSRHVAWSKTWTCSPTSAGCNSFLPK